MKERELKTERKKMQITDKDPEKFFECLSE